MLVLVAMPNTITMSEILFSVVQNAMVTLKSVICMVGRCGSNIKTVLKFASQ